MLIPIEQFYTIIKNKIIDILQNNRFDKIINESVSGFKIEFPGNLPVKRYNTYRIELYYYNYKIYISHHLYNIFLDDEIVINVSESTCYFCRVIINNINRDEYIHLNNTENNCLSFLNNVSKHKMFFNKDIHVNDNTKQICSYILYTLLYNIKLFEINNLN